MFINTFYIFIFSNGKNIIQLLLDLSIDINLSSEQKI